VLVHGDSTPEAGELELFVRLLGVAQVLTGTTLAKVGR